MQITQAVILAGGAGTRLQPFTLNSPKPMIKVNGKPFLEHLILHLKDNGIKEVIILTGYLGEKIEKYFQNGTKLGLKIKYSYTPFKDFFGTELKSGIRILNAQKLLKEHFLLLYCDNYWPFNLKQLEQVYFRKKPKILLTVYSNVDNSTKNNCFVSSQGYIEKYDKLRLDPNLNGVDIGFMVVRKNVLNLLPKENSKFEDVVFPKLIAKKSLVGFLTDQKYYSISDLKRARITAKFLKPKKVILLDRDGVINKKAPKAQYIKNWEEFVFLPRVLEAIKKLRQAKYKIFIISNQAGIARKVMTKKDLVIIHQKMMYQIKKAGGKIDGIYYCPHGWDEGCSCRKPKPGLLYKASREHLFDLSKAIFIGDDIRDKQTGDAALCKTILLSKKKSLYHFVNLMIYSSSVKYRNNE